MGWRRVQVRTATRPRVSEGTAGRVSRIRVQVQIGPQHPMEKQPSSSTEADNFVCTLTA